MSEQDTFDRLRREPVEDVYDELCNLMLHILHRDKLSEINSQHPDVKEFLKSKSYTREEILDHHITQYPISK